MKQGSSFARKQGSAIALACAAVFAAPHAMAQVATPDFGDGKGLTLGVDFLIGIASKNATGAAAGPNSNSVRRTEVFSSSSDIWLHGSEKLNAGFIQGWGFHWQSAFDPDEYNRRGSTEGDWTVIGVRTTAGSIFIGMMDNPYKQIGSRFWSAGSSWGNGMSQSGVIGNMGFRDGTSKGSRCGDAELSGASSASLPCAAAASTTASMGFYRQVNNSVNWYSPDMSGFKAYAMWAPGDNDIAAGTDLVVGASTFHLQNTRLLEGGVTYNNGPIEVGFVYAQHKDFLWGNSLTGNNFGIGSATAGTGDRSKDTAKLVGAKYTFGMFSIGGGWQRLEYNQSGGSLTATSLTDISVDSWWLGTQIKLGGPHAIALQYGQADDYKCNGNYASAAMCNDSGMQYWGIGYNYVFSKQFKIFASVSKMDNDTHAMYAGHAPVGSRVGAGAAQNQAGINFNNYSFGLNGKF